VNGFADARARRLNTGQGNGFQKVSPLLERGLKIENHQPRMRVVA
jgi:hypothetical protein